MTGQEIKLLQAFNAWATTRIFDAVASLPHEDVIKDMKSSHTSIHGTILHQVLAERRWLHRWTGGPAVKPMTAADAPTVAALRRLWEQTGYDGAKFFSTLTDQKLQAPLTYTDVAGQKTTLPLWQSVLHVVDHSTYHRGQVVALFRQLGHTPPSTGMALLFREVAKIA